MTDFFKSVSNDENNPIGGGGHLICNKCGKRVERGIINVSSHWAECYNDDFKLSFAKAALETSKTFKEFEERMETLKKL